MANNNRSKKVVIIQKYIPRFRLEFFDLLQQELLANGIELVLVYGQPGESDSKKMDAIDVLWGNKIKNFFIRIASKELVWQPVFPHIVSSDLIIVEQANKLLVNYLLLLLNFIKFKKLAFWGHGKNFQATKTDLGSERLKSWLSRRVHWWFAYNDLSYRIIRDNKFPEDRITVVNNSIDTRSLIKQLRSIDLSTIKNKRKEIGLHGKHVGLYVGSMYFEKKLKFLLDACFLIREKVPDFEMIFVGAGPDAHHIEEASRDYSWIKYVGRQFGDDKVILFALSSVVLMPGLVGLAVLDSFALEVPLITTRDAAHSPEIDYLKNGVNGIVVDEGKNEKFYAQVVIETLLNEDQRKKLVEGCKVSREFYSTEEMVDRFCKGIVRALASR